MPRGRRRSLRNALFKPALVLDENDRFVLKRCAEYLIRLLNRYPLTDRRAAIVACLNLTRQEPRPIIIVDEADNLLNTEYSWFRRGETQDKGWLNQLLEVPGLRMIWITNDIGSIEDSVLRRFAYSLRFKPFNRRQRLQLWENVLKGQQAKSRLDGPEVLALAKKYRVSAGGVELVVRKALEAGRTEKKAFHRSLELGLSAHQTLLNGRIEKQNGPDRIETGYCLEGLNLEGNPRELMTRLDQFNRYLRQTDRKEIRNFNLLFYGPPGTGKSELARYIAEQLDRELTVKRASDLLNAYVGATEQLIRRAFEEAEREEAVLVLDEADTFLFSRDRAVRSWEISFTNEFLTQMERFRGILICTTNRMTDLDQASIRRFNHKIRFDYLTPEGNRIFYERFLQEMISQALSTADQALLMAQPCLAPGDFKVVRDRFAFAPAEAITPEALIRALIEEAKIKMASGEKKVVGF